MSTTMKRRLQKRQEAADALETHTGPVMGLLAQVVHDLAEEVDGLKQFETDAAYAAELAYRLDKAVKLSDPLLEALDGIVIFFVALAAIGIWRAASRREKLRGERVEVLRKRLGALAPGMAQARRQRLQRRIRRLEA